MTYYLIYDSNNGAGLGVTFEARDFLEATRIARAIAFADHSITIQSVMTKKSRGTTYQVLT